MAFLALLPLLLLPCIADAILCPSILGTPSSNCSTPRKPPASRPLSSGWVAHPNDECSPTILLANNTNFSLAFLPSNLDFTSLSSPSSSTYLLSLLIMPQDPQYCEAVWTANRNHPVAGNAKLKLGTADQGLVLVDADGSVVWSMNARGAVGMRLEDSGSLVVYDSANGSLYRSSDHPTDTLLPGSSAGFGKKLVSSVSSGNQSESIYSVAIEPGGMVLYVNTPSPLPYWLWGNDVFLNFSAMFETPCNRTILVYASDGLSASLQQDPMTAGCKRVWDPKWDYQGFSRPTAYARIDPDGDFRLYDTHRKRVFDIIKNNGGVDCDLPGICGRYGICMNGSSSHHCICPKDDDDNSPDPFKPINVSSPELGCRLQLPLPSCNSASQDGNFQLLQMSGVDYFANDLINQTITTLYNCKQSCLSNCSCLVAFYRQNSQACYQFQHVMSSRFISDKSYLAFFKVESASTGELSQASTSSHSSSTKKKLMIAFSIVGSLLVLFVVAGISSRYFCLKASKATEEEEFLVNLAGCPARYSLRQLDVATSGFSKMLGKGGFGTVYEGYINRTKVAIKRLDNNRQGPKEFLAEVAALGSISHVNLVRLCGFCAERSHCLLVYQYMANKSLDKWLFTEDGVFLDWNKRFNIALGVARGLAFLHEESRQKIIHMDIKPQNILLDDNFVAKLSDFGLSKLLDGTQSWTFTGMRGTLGYLAPECVLQMAVSTKCDVYSYGMVLLELVGGRKNFEMNLETEQWYYPAWAIEKVKEGKIGDVIDSSIWKGGLMSDESKEQALRTIKVAFWCIQEDINVRPPMGKVVLMLEGHIKVNDPPWSLPFQRRTQAQLAAAAISIASSSTSQNQLFSSTLSGR